MAVTAIFTNHFSAVDACNELGEMGCIVEAGWDKMKGRGKKATQLIIDVPQDFQGRLSNFMATIEGIVAKYEGIVL